MSRTFFLAAVAVSVLLTGFLHVRSAEWVFEDGTWRNGGAKPFGDLYWERYQMPTLTDTLTSFPNRHWTAWTFYDTPDNPVYAHALNLAVHIVNALLFALLLNRLGLPGFLAAGLFVLHPLTTDAVAYASGRSELLSATAMLGCLWFGLASKNASIWRWGGLLGSLVLGLGSKPTFAAYVVPMLLMMDWTLQSRTRLRWLSPVLGVLTVLAGVAAIAILTRHQALPDVISLPRWFGVQAVAFWSLAGATILPVHLSIDHAWFAAPTWMQLAAGMGLIMAADYLLARALFAPSVAVIGAMWFLIPLLPRLFVRDSMGWMREHHAYLSLMGACVVLASVFEGMVRHESRSESVHTGRFTEAQAGAAACR